MNCFSSPDGKTRLALLLLVVSLVNLTSPKTTRAVTDDAKTSAAQIFANADSLRAAQQEASNVEAIIKYREAGELWRTAGEFREAAVAFRNAGEIFQLLGNSAGAKQSFDEALASTKKIRNSLEEARIRNDLAYLHFIDGDTAQAKTNCESALRIARALHDRTIEAEALSNLGETFYNLGELGNAQQHQQQSLAIWRELNNDRGQAIALTALAYYYANLGEPVRALQSGDEGLSHARAAKDLGVEALALIAVGNIKRKFGENQESLTAYESAKVLAERIGDKTSQAILTAGLGGVSLAMGDQQKALEYLETATRLFEGNGKKWGAAEGKLGVGTILQTRGENDKALEVLTEALALSRSLSMRRFESQTLRTMGLVYRAQGDNKAALRAFQQALTLLDIDRDQRQAAYTLNYIGQSYEDLKETTRAETHYRRALTLSQSAADPENETLSLYNLAHLERDRGNLAEASRQVQAAIAITESMRTKVSSHELRTSYFATVRDTYDLYIDILMLQHKQNPTSGFDHEAFAVSEKARARSFLEIFREAQANVREGADPALLSRERQLGEAFNVKEQLQIQLLAAKKNIEAAQIEKDLEALTAELSQVRDQIKASSPRFAALTTPQPLNLKETQARVLDNETTLLEFAFGNERSYAWVVTRDGVSSFELPARAEIEDSAKRLYTLFKAYAMIYGESTGARAERQASTEAAIPFETAILSRLVLTPLAGKLNTKRLLVIPDGMLQYIPFSILIDPDSKQPLINKHEIVNEPSASALDLLLSEMGARKPAARSIAVLADPVFEIDDPRVNRGAAGALDQSKEALEVRQALRDAGVSPDGLQIPRLFASGREANEIMALAPSRTSLKAIGFAANRDQILNQQLASYRIVHFATHGIINSEHPELSGIVLSLFDREGRPQNGFLRLQDIYNLRLPADLVVLSACSTALGKDVRGEGLIGLTRGFMYAGASGVIASLWKVDDDATAELMKLFYDAMFRKGMSPAAALRDAQLAMSQSNRWRAPYYWAGFVIQGQYRQTEKFTEPFLTNNQFALLGGTFALLGLMFLIRRRRRRHS